MWHNGDGHTIEIRNVEILRISGRHVTFSWLATGRFPPPGPPKIKKHSNVALKNQNTSTQYAQKSCGIRN